MSTGRPKAGTSRAKASKANDPTASTSSSATSAAPTEPPPTPAMAAPAAVPAVRIKQEPGTATIKTERLPSFREQRDLTLGGLGAGRSSRSTANKKVFVPNLNVARNRNADVHTSRDTSASSSSGRGSRGRGAKSERGAGRGGSKSGSTLIQTAGLFSEGTGEAKLRKSSSVFDRNSGAGDSASQLRRPTLLKQEAKVDQAAERRSIREVLGTSMPEGVDDDEERNLTEGLNGADAMTGVAADLFGPIALNDMQNATAARQAQQHPVAESLEELFAKREQQLFLVQLPDTLPGHGPDVEPAESAEAENRAAAAAAAALQSNHPLTSFCTAKQLDDGLIGRIVRRKSGKIQMLLGDLVFNLSLGIDAGMLQEVMSVQTSETDRRHGTLNNLGPVQAKLNVTPDWARLFALKEAEANAASSSTNGIGLS